MKLHFLLLIFALLICSMALAACGQRRTPKAVDSNGVATLFVDEDGCKVKKFTDGTIMRYYAVCPHANSTVSNTISSGTITTVDEVSTVVR